MKVRQKVLSFIQSALPSWKHPEPFAIEEISPHGELSSGFFIIVTILYVDTLENGFTKQSLHNKGSFLKKEVRLFSKIQGNLKISLCQAMSCLDKQKKDHLRWTEFKTPTKRIELYSTVLEKEGYEPFAHLA